MIEKREAHAAVPQLPQPGERWREARRLKHVCAAALLCTVVGLLCCAAVPDRVNNSVSVDSVFAPTVRRLDALDFTDAAFARAQQTADWRYDAQWAREYPGVATYRSGDNFVSCGSLYIEGRPEEAARVLLAESALDFVCQTDETEGLQCYAAPLDEAQVLLYLCVQKSGAGATLAWAQVYLAATNTIEREKAAAAANEFVRQTLQSGAELLA